MESCFWHFELHQLLAGSSRAPLPLMEPDRLSCGRKREPRAPEAGRLAGGRGVPSVALAYAVAYDLLL